MAIRTGPNLFTRALKKEKHQLIVKPAKLKSRLMSMARKDALIVIPEGWEEWVAGEILEIQLLNPDFNYR